MFIYEPRQTESRLMIARSHATPSVSLFCLHASCVPLNVFGQVTRCLIRPIPGPRVPQIGVAVRQRHSRLSAKEMDVPEVSRPVVHGGGQRGRDNRARAGPAGSLLVVRGLRHGRHVRGNHRQPRVTVVVVPVVVRQELTPTDYFV